MMLSKVSYFSYKKLKIIVKNKNELLSLKKQIIHEDNRLRNNDYQERIKRQKDILNSQKEQLVDKYIDKLDHIDRVKKKKQLMNELNRKMINM